MTNHLTTQRVAAIEQALQIDTTRMGRYEIAAVWKLADDLISRLSCEVWAESMGWDIPPYLSLEWREMHAAWLESEDK